MLLSDKEIEAIATLACKRVFGDAYNARGLSERAMIFSIREAIRLTAERCAQLCDQYPERDPAEDGNGYWAAADCAQAIRDAAK